MTIHQATGTVYIVEIHSNWQDDYSVGKLGYTRGLVSASKLIAESMKEMSGLDAKYHEWVITRIVLKGAKTIIHEVWLNHTKGHITVTKDMWKEVK